MDPATASPSVDPDRLLSGFIGLLLLSFSYVLLSVASRAVANIPDTGCMVPLQSRLTYTGPVSLRIQPLPSQPCTVSGAYPPPGSLLYLLLS